MISFGHSVRSDFTGFAIAAFIACNPTEKTAMITASNRQK
jgi:hypothetical protein